MKNKGLQFVILLTLVALLLLSCKQASLEAPGPDYGRGKVEDYNIEKGIQVATFLQSDLKEEKKIELNYGLMDVYFITIDGNKYMVYWNDLEDFKALKRGEEISFRIAGYIGRVQKYGKNFKVIKLNEL